MITLDAQGYDPSGNWYSAAARRALGVPDENGELTLGGFLVKASARDTIRNGRMVGGDGNPISGPVMIRGGRPVVVKPNEPAYLAGQAIAEAAVAGQQRSATTNAANAAFWAKGARA